MTIASAMKRKIPALNMKRARDLGEKLDVEINPSDIEDVVPAGTMFVCNAPSFPFFDRWHLTAEEAKEIQVAKLKWAWVQRGETLLSIGSLKIEHENRFGRTEIYYVSNFVRSKDGSPVSLMQTSVDELFCKHEHDGDIMHPTLYFLDSKEGQDIIALKEKKKM